VKEYAIGLDARCSLHLSPEFLPSSFRPSLQPDSQHHAVKYKGNCYVCTTHMDYVRTTLWPRVRVFYRVMQTPPDPTLQNISNAVIKRLHPLTSPRHRATTNGKFHGHGAIYMADLTYLNAREPSECPESLAVSFHDSRKRMQQYRTMPNKLRKPDPHIATLAQILTITLISTLFLSISPRPHHHTPLPETLHSLEITCFISEPIIFHHPTTTILNYNTTTLGNNNN
jgi:hypothetical protein